MSEIKPKLILRPGLNISEKSPSPSTKLMLNHGKPNFTINRSKSKIDGQTPPTPTTPEASQVVLKSTTFNGIVKTSNLNISTENEVHKVVLRKTKLAEMNGKPEQGEEVNRVVLRRTKLPEANGKAVPDDEPEFIKAQRKIAERLAKEDNLDFENRKSGYFTHVMMSPTTTNKTFELPATQSASIQHASLAEVAEVPENVVEPVAVVENGKTEVVEEPKQNGHANGDLIESNGAIDADTEVVQVAKALVEDVVQSVHEDIPAPVVAPEPVQNGVQNGDSHIQSPSQTSDVNFEPKTVTSFSKDLANEPNNYPDTVVVTKEVEPDSNKSKFIEEMNKLKFDIHTDDLEVTPTLRLETETPVA